MPVKARNFKVLTKEKDLTDVVVLESIEVDDDDGSHPSNSDYEMTDSAATEVANIDSDAGTVSGRVVTEVITIDSSDSGSDSDSSEDFRPLWMISGVFIIGYTGRQRRARAES